jgi:hypothetical protein
MTDKCNICQGHGFWPIGAMTPIGSMDAEEWKGMVLKCPSCKKGDVTHPQLENWYAIMLARKTQ